MQSASIPALVIRRTYGALPERVYAAWTDPLLARQFLCPEGVDIAEIDLDVRAGGTYRIVMQRPDGEKLVVRGVYREVRPGERLSMTWSWEEDDPRDEHETLLTIDFTRDKGGTELTLTHEHFAREESRSNHEHGWLSVLTNMERL